MKSVGNSMNGALIWRKRNNESGWMQTLDNILERNVYQIYFTEIHNEV